MYRALFALCAMQGVVGEVTVAMHNLILASLVTLCIAVGVAIPNVFFRRLINGNHEKVVMDMLMKGKILNGEMLDLPNISKKN